MALSSKSNEMIGGAAVPKFSAIYSASSSIPMFELLHWLPKALLKHQEASEQSQGVLFITWTVSIDGHPCSTLLMAWVLRREMPLEYTMVRGSDEDWHYDRPGSSSSIRVLLKGKGDSDRALDWLQLRLDVSIGSLPADCPVHR